MTRVLVLHLDSPASALRQTTRDHLAACCRIPEWEAIPWNAAKGVPPRSLRRSAAAVLLHTTYLCLRWTPRFHAWRTQSAWIRDCRVPVVALPQDEYDHAWVLDEWLAELGTTAVLSVLAPEHWPLLYPRLVKAGAMIRRVLTGYLSDDPVMPDFAHHGDRPFDVVYRASKLPFRFGSHGQLKHELGERAAEACLRLGLTHDISTRPEDLVQGPAWMDFLRSGRAVVGCESGSSVFDPYGQVQRDELAQRPKTFGAFVQPAGWDDYRFPALSPRHLEAIEAGCAQILVEGDYSGVLHAGEHYLPVKPDLSNLGDSLETVRDRKRTRDLAERAWWDIAQGFRHRWAALGAAIKDVLW